MTKTAEIADFAGAVDADELDADVVEELKKRVLDSVGIGIGALGEPPVEAVAETVTEVGGDGSCRLWARSSTASPSHAAMHNTALTRYLAYWTRFSPLAKRPTPATTSRAQSPVGSASMPRART